MEPIERPTPVRTALLLLWIALAAMALIRLSSMATDAPGDAPYWMVIVLTTGTVGILAIFDAFLIFMVGRRHNWARIVYLALFAYGLIAVFFSVFTGKSAAAVMAALMALLPMAMRGYALYLLFLDARSAQWFRPHAASAPGHGTPPPGSGGGRGGYLACLIGAITGGALWLLFAFLFALKINDTSEWAIRYDPVVQEQIGNWALGLGVLMLAVIALAVAAFILRRRVRGAAPAAPTSATASVQAPIAAPPAPAAAPAPPGSPESAATASALSSETIDALHRLKSLLDDAIIDQEEFQRGKRRLLGHPDAPPGEALP